MFGMMDGLCRLHCGRKKVGIDCMGHGSLGCSVRLKAGSMIFF